MKWYLVDLLFAQAPQGEMPDVICERCHVLFEASSALAAYDKAIEWANHYTQEGSFLFVGVEHMSSLIEAPGDGVEIAGRFFESEDVWLRQDEHIPTKENIQAIMLERNSDVPVGELMTEEQKQKFKRIFGEADES